MVSISPFVLTFVFIYLIFKFFESRRQKLPPGPIGLPIIGNLLSLSHHPFKNFREWSKQYGPIVSARLGITKVVILNDSKLIREAYNEHVFSGRPQTKLFTIFAGGNYDTGVISSQCSTWVEQRRFTLKNLRDFGFGKQSMEKNIMEEVNELIAWMKKNEGNPISLNHKFSVAVLNSLWMIIAGQRYDHDDPKPYEILEGTTVALKNLTEKGYLMFFPELADISPKWSGYLNLLEGFRPMLRIFEAAVAEHEANPAEEQSPRDFIDVYINEIHNTTDPNSSFYKEKGRRNLLTVAADLYFAGADTTSSTLEWSLLYMMTHPEEQNKVHAELDEVIGKNRLPMLSDRPSTPYIEATLNEIFRLSDIFPMGVFHAALENTKFHGYDIEKGTMIIANHHSVHFDKSIWGDPENFRPERFLSPDGKTVLKNEHLIAFSVGKRQCLGELLARDTLYLFFTSILQRFQVLLDPTDSKPSLEAAIGFIQKPQKFSVILKDRIY